MQLKEVYESQIDLLVFFEENEIKDMSRELQYLCPKTNSRL